MFTNVTNADSIVNRLKCYSEKFGRELYLTQKIPSKHELFAGLCVVNYLHQPFLELCHLLKMVEMLFHSLAS